MTATVTGEVRRCLELAGCARWSQCGTTWTSTWSSCGCRADAQCSAPAYEARSQAVHPASCCQATVSAAAGKMSSCTAGTCSVACCSSMPGTPGWTYARCRPEYGRDSCTLRIDGERLDIEKSETVCFHISVQPTTKSLNTDWYHTESSWFSTLFRQKSICCTRTAVTLGRNMTLQIS